MWYHRTILLFVHWLYLSRLNNNHQLEYLKYRHHFYAFKIFIMTSIYFSPTRKSKHKPLNLLLTKYHWNSKEIMSDFYFLKIYLVRCCKYCWKICRIRYVRYLPTSRSVFLVFVIYLTLKKAEDRIYNLRSSAETA